jgi:hypothetical protein
MKLSLAELLERSNENLSNFLRIELELGTTFARQAKYYREQGNTERFEISKRNALTALAAIDHFKDRLPQNFRINIDDGRAELSRLLSTL